MECQRLPVKQDPAVSTIAEPVKEFQEGALARS